MSDLRLRGVPDDLPPGVELTGSTESGSFDFVEVDGENVLARSVPFASTPEETAKAIAAAINSEDYVARSEGTAVAFYTRGRWSRAWFRFVKWLRGYGQSERETARGRRQARAAQEV